MKLMQCKNSKKISIKESEKKKLICGAKEAEEEEGRKNVGRRESKWKKINKSYGRAGRITG